MISSNCGGYTASIRPSGQPAWRGHDGCSFSRLSADLMSDISHYSPSAACATSVVRNLKHILSLQRGKIGAFSIWSPPSGRISVLRQVYACGHTNHDGTHVGGSDQQGAKSSGSRRNQRSSGRTDRSTGLSPLVQAVDHSVCALVTRAI